MAQTLISALWIGVIGLGLVFLALALLWVIMSVLVNATAKQALAEAAEDEESEEAGEAPAGEEVTAGPPDAALGRQKAAAAAVAVALAMQNKGRVAIRHPALTPESGSFSAWQSVLRSNQLNQKSRMYSRKQRGNGQ